MKILLQIVILALFLCRMQEISHINCNFFMTIWKFSFMYRVVNLKFSSTYRVFKFSYKFSVMPMSNADLLFLWCMSYSSLWRLVINLALFLFTFYFTVFIVLSTYIILFTFFLSSFFSFERNLCSHVLFILVRNDNEVCFFFLFWILILSDPY